MNINHSIRATNQHSKDYINYLVTEFSVKWVEKYKRIYPDKQIAGIEFRKQDMRGSPSITLFDTAHCVPHQIHFDSYKEMIAFMQGFAAVSRDYI